VPGARGEELLWGRQPGSDKGSVLVISDSCAFHYVRGYLGSVGGGSLLGTSGTLES
jgi:hypothetical protein